MGMIATPLSRGANTGTTRRIGIIGAGGTATVLLERIAGLASQSPDQHFEVFVWDKNPPGPGVHQPDISELLPLNTVAGQIGVFPDAAGKWDSAIEGPSFFDWLCSSPETAKYRAWEFVPRRFCGAYLADAFHLICSKAPANVRIVVSREKVTAVTRAVSSCRLQVKTAVSSLWVDHLCFCVGHVGRKRSEISSNRSRVIDNCYPLPGALTSIQQGDLVGIEGMGLAASDVITMLTQYRGGGYERKGDQLVYIASGREPQIWLYSRSGMPFHARPLLPLERRPHRPLVLTKRKIDLLRAARGLDMRLDFASDVLPLLKLELSIAFHCTRAGLYGEGNRSRLRLELQRYAELADPDESRLEAELDRLDQTTTRFDRDRPFAVRPPRAFRGARYREWLIAFLKEDIAGAEAGALLNPHKAALEVCRDLRDILRYVVDFDGLTEVSSREFYSVYAPLFNRLVGGPTAQRSRELLALLRAGVVRVPDGPVSEMGPDPIRRFRLIQAKKGGEATPRHVALDWIVKAHVETSGIICGASGPVDDLHKAGMLTSSRSVSGLDGVRVDQLSRPVDASGQLVETLAFLGPLTEGARYYNHYLASPTGPCRLRDDADLIARRLLGLPFPVIPNQHANERKAP
jgi:uncharacterized NAD(P)/FAD-binding protein YdhS